jgi:Signal transduction histidine kinase
MKKNCILLLVLLFLVSCQSNQNYAELAKTSVHNAAIGLAAIINDIENPEEQIIIIRKFISPIRFYPDNSGYFYVYNSNCINIAHATQKGLEGKNLYDHRDVKGKYVIRELLQTAQQGGGFVEFYWQKPDNSGEYRKLGYVEMIPGTDFFIGSGVYLE